MSFATYRRQEILGLKQHDTAAAGQAVTHYLEKIAAMNDRRLMWLCEQAAEARAEALDRHEQQQAQHAHCKRPEQAAKEQEYIDRYTEDFRFLLALATLLRDRIFEKSAEDFAQYFQRAHGGVLTRKKK